MKNVNSLNLLQETLASRNIQLDRVIAALKSQVIETPSWTYGNGGTRFKVFKQKGAARNIFEKIDDAACVHKFTGVTPSVAVHALFDFEPGNVKKIRDYAESKGLKIGAINPTLYEQDEYKFGSLAHPDTKVQEKAFAHVLDCVKIMKDCSSKYMSLWFADGTDYPGQDDMRQRKHRMQTNLCKAAQSLDAGMEMLIEYKFFEPAFYSTDIGDWGMAYVFAKHCGPQAKVLVDLGHHPLGTNIAQIVAFLIDENMLGGFHFNSKKYADDDLTTASMDPYELFLIFNELVAAAGGCGLYNVPYMIDQSHITKPKIEAMIQSVMNIQEIYAKALCIDQKALSQAQSACDVVAAEQILRAAFFTDVTPLLEATREQMNIPANPLAAYKASGYQKQIESAR